MDGPGYLASVPGDVAIASDAAFWVLHGRGTLSRFDGRGNFLGDVGRQGDGPGEMRRPSLSFKLPGDSMAVLDPQMTILSSFGSSREELRGYRTGAGRLRYSLAHSADGNVWAVAATSYRIEQWTGDGKLLQTLERRPEWFPAAWSMGIGSASVPPDPRMLAISETAEGLLWVYALTPSPRYREAWRRTAPAGGGEQNLSGLDTEALYQTTVDVIDPRSHRLVANHSASFPHAPRAARWPNRGRACVITRCAGRCHPETQARSGVGRRRRSGKTTAGIEIPTRACVRACVRLSHRGLAALQRGLDSPPASSNLIVMEGRLRHLR